MGYYWPALPKGSRARTWTKFVSGFLIGGAATSARYLPWDSCMQDIFSLMIDAYAAYVYIEQSVL